MHRIHFRLRLYFGLLGLRELTGLFIPLPALYSIRRLRRPDLSAFTIGFPMYLLTGW